MKISTRGRYALRALLELAKTYQTSKKMTLKEIAKNQHLSVKYLGALLNQLSQNDLVKSFKGKYGGYVLKKAPKEITLLNIIEAVEGPLALIDCIKDTDGPQCSRKHSCLARCAWSALNNDISNIFNKYNLEVLLNNFEDVVKEEDNAINTQQLNP